MGVLCRFRRVAIVLTCDAKGMFHQLFVNGEYGDLLRILLVGSRRFEELSRIWRGIISGSCANYGFTKATDDGEKEFGTSCAGFMRRDFYVDDGLKSVKDASTAVSLI